MSRAERKGVLQPSSDDYKLVMSQMGFRPSVILTNDLIE